MFSCCIFFCGIISAQKFNVFKKNGAIETLALSDIKKITFSDTSINIGKTDNSIQNEIIADVRKITFANNVPTAITESPKVGNESFIYPNPSENYINIVCNLKTSGNVIVEFSSIEGIVLKSISIPNQSVGKFNYTINHGLFSGIYLCRIKSGDVINTIKLFVR